MYIFEGEDSETDEEPTNDDVGLNCINHTPSTHFLLLDVSPSNKLKRTIGEKVLTHSSKLEIRVVR